MKTLIIYAHPNTNGHCSTLLEELIGNLESKNIDYELIDLYKLKYDPVLKENELYTAGNNYISKQNKEFQNKISNCDRFIFIYPNWWNSPPAILKGFIDRTFTPGFGFKYEGKIPKGLLKGRKAAIFLTTGSPILIFKFFSGSRAAKIMKKDFLRFCGISSKAFIIGNANKIDGKQIKKIKEAVKKGMDYLY